MDGLEEEISQYIVGDIKKPRAIAPVYAGARAAYFGVPYTSDRVNLAKSFLDQCVEHGVEYAVLSSVIGADLGQTRYQQMAKEIEDYAKTLAGKPVKLAAGDKGKLKLKVVTLRSAPYFQNMYMLVKAIKAKGTLYYPLGDVDHRTMHVNLDDYGKAVAFVLMSPETHATGDFTSYNIAGVLQSGPEIASNIAMRAGIHCKYERVDDETAMAAFQAASMNPDDASGYVETLAWFRSGRGMDTECDMTRITGAPARDFRDFVKEGLKSLLKD